MEWQRRCLWPLCVLLLALMSTSLASAQESGHVRTGRRLLASPDPKPKPATSPPVKPTAGTPSPNPKRSPTSKVSPKKSPAKAPPKSPPKPTASPKKSPAVKPPVPSPSPFPSPSPSPCVKNCGGSKTPVGAIVGGVVGGVVFLAALVGGYLFYQKKQGGAGGAGMGATGAATVTKTVIPVAATDTRPRRDQLARKPTAFPVGRDPSLLNRSLQELSQAGRSVTHNLQQAAPTGYLQNLESQVGLISTAVADKSPLPGAVLQHMLWDWLSYQLWEPQARMARPPIFPDTSLQGQTPAELSDKYNSCLQRFKAAPEQDAQSISQMVDMMVDDLHVPADAANSCRPDLMQLVESAIQLRLAVGAVDPNCTVLVSRMGADPQQPPVRLPAPQDGRQRVRRTLLMDRQTSAGQVTPGVAFCYLPGIGVPNSGYVYAEEEVVTLGSQ